MFVKVENCHFIQNCITLFLKIYNEYEGGFSGQTNFQETHCFNISRGENTGGCGVVTPHQS